MIDKNLIIGKWKYVRTPLGQGERDYEYNGNPQLTFEQNGRWITEDSNPNYRQKGNWKFDKKNLIRNPDKTETRDRPPYKVEIAKLTHTELVITTPLVMPIQGQYRITFYLKKLE